MYENCAHLSLFFFPQFSIPQIEWKLCRSTEWNSKFVLGKSYLCLDVISRPQNGSLCRFPLILCHYSIRLGVMQNKHYNIAATKMGHLVDSRMIEQSLTVVGVIVQPVVVGLCWHTLFHSILPIIHSWNHITYTSPQNRCMKLPAFWRLRSTQLLVAGL